MNGIKRNSGSNWRLIVGVIVMMIAGFMSYWCAMMSIRPPDRKEHHWLFTLTPIGSAEEYFFKRLAVLRPGIFFVAGHSSGGLDGIQYIKDQRHGTSRLITAKQAAHEITQEKLKRGIAATVPIYLLTCNGGSGTYSFARELSDILKVDVIAPDQWLFVYPWGKAGTGRNVVAAFLNAGGSSFKYFEFPPPLAGGPNA